ncbi:MAG: CoA pyrophosphatase [Pseudomonadota bacterium]
MDADLVTARLAHTRPPRDPSAAVAAETGALSRLIAPLGKSLIPAGVLIPLFDREAELTVLLTERSAELKHHAGQIAFPGGRMEVDDGSIAETALREAHEEVGIAPASVQLAGYLASMPTVSGYAVTPVVGFVDTSVELVLDPGEVSDAFEVPLGFVMDERNQRTGTRHYGGREFPVVEFQYDRHRIWGATAYMLVELKKLLENN